MCLCAFKCMLHACTHLCAWLFLWTQTQRERESERERESPTGPHCSTFHIMHECHWQTMSHYTHTHLYTHVHISTHMHCAAPCSVCLTLFGRVFMEAMESGNNFFSTLMSNSDAYEDACSLIGKYLFQQFRSKNARVTLRGWSDYF